MDKKQHTVVVVGLPASGKTTFLAALWDLVCRSNVQKRMQFAGLRTGNRAHLNEIADRWREARVQERTALRGDRAVTIDLINASDAEVQLQFPDIAGEAFGQMWERRDCEPSVAAMLRDDGVLLFIHADMIKQPIPIVSIAAMAGGCDIQDGNDQESVLWEAKFAPTQVQVVSLLSMLRESVLRINNRPRRLAVMLSAWDRVQNQGTTPKRFLELHLPLLRQYLNQATDRWESRVYGVSAQGCPYDKAEVATRSAEALAILDLDPSQRIKLVLDQQISNDLTEPIEWLIG